MPAKGQFIAVCHRGHPKTGDNLYIAPNGRRVCVECTRIAGRKWVRTHRGNPDRVYLCRTLRHCAYCGQGFYPAERSQQCCSPSCRTAHRRSIPERSCIQCGATIRYPKTRVFCDVTCYRAHQRALHAEHETYPDESLFHYGRMRSLDEQVFDELELGARLEADISGGYW